MSKINTNIKQIRENQRLTQSEFSDILGVSRSTITKIEGGMIELSKKMLLKLQNSFPKEFNLPYDDSNMIGNDNESDIIISVISANLGRIEQVKEVIKAMSLNTDYSYNETKFLNRFLLSSKRLDFDANYLIFEDKSIKYEYRFLIDFLKITKECLYSIYEDLFDFSSVKYLYRNEL